MKTFGCSHNPILLDGVLVFVEMCEGNRTLKDPKGFYILEQGKIVLFNNLRTIGKVYTDRYGELVNYTNGGNQ